MDCCWSTGTPSGNVTILFQLAAGNGGSCRETHYSGTALQLTDDSLRGNTLFLRTQGNGQHLLLVKPQDLVLHKMQLLPADHRGYDQDDRK